MLTRRELVTGSALGAIGTVGAHIDPGTPAVADLSAQDVDNAALRRIADKATELAGAVRSNSLAYGFVPVLRRMYTEYWRIHSKFPDFCEVGPDIFYDIYDWHIKNRQPIPLSRLGNGRLSITFMFTELLVRVEQDPGYIGVPFDRG
jgi:hypothetical protein